MADIHTWALIKIGAPNDQWGNPRRAWIVIPPMTHSRLQRPVVIEEGYGEGADLLASLGVRYGFPVETIAVSVTEYKRWLRYRITREQVAMWQIDPAKKIPEVQEG